MKLAVLMSTYNGARFLREQIESILNQKVDAQVDLWVRDDGSTDGTRDILDEYAAEGRLQWYTGENLKPAKSFLDLIRRVEDYDYYAFADQDDRWHPDKLYRGVEKLRDFTVPGVYCANARLVDERMEDLGRSVYRNPPKTDFYSVTCGAGILGCTMIFNEAAAALVRARPLPETLRMHDYYVCVLCTLCGGQIVYEHTECLEYRQHSSNAVGSSWRKTDALKNRIRQITVKRETTLDILAKHLCESYGDLADPEKRKWLQEVARYRDSVWSALKLAADRKPSYSSLNKSITLRAAIALRNR